MTAKTAVSRKQATRRYIKLAETRGHGLVRLGKVGLDFGHGKLGGEVGMKKKFGKYS